MVAHHQGNYFTGLIDEVFNERWTGGIYCCYKALFNPTAGPFQEEAQ